MPIFEYHCKNCQEEFEQIVFNGKTKIKCPKCQGGKVSKKVSAFSFKSGSKFVAASASKGCGGCSSHNCGSCH